jgi:Zn-dependent protease/CBS domain-containing protein
MFSTRWHLFRLLGIPIGVDASWLVILALLTWTLVGEFRKIEGLSPAASWLLGLVTALGFFACIVLHEMGHAVVARRRGIPIRGITLFLFGGVAELEGEPKDAPSEFLMAIAGPLVSLVLAAAFWILWVVGRGTWPQALTAMLFFLAWINTAVLVFNMLPAFPLDGGRVLRSILWGASGSLRRATRWASLAGQAFAWLLIGVGIWNFFQGAFISGLWMGLIGLFLNQAARGSYQQVLIRQMLQGEPIARFMNAAPIVVPPSLDLQHWVEDYVYRHHRKAFPVASDGRLEGIISTAMLADYPRDEWGQHTVGEVMRRDLGPVSIAPDTDALQALSQMQRTGSSRLLVTDGDRLVGIVSLKDLLGFLNLKLELEGEEASGRAAASEAPAGRAG